LPYEYNSGVVDRKQGNNIMKITKRQLRRIIKEEKAKLLKEVTAAAGAYPKTAADWVETLGQLIDQDMTARGADLRAEGSEVVKALEMLRREYTDEMRGPTR
jgi:hypothetical protein